MKLTHKILIPVLIMLGLTFAMIDVLSINIIQKTVLEEKAQLLIEHADRQKGEKFTSTDFRKSPSDPSLLPHITKYIHALQDPAIFRVKVWSPDGRVIYSDFANLIGEGGMPRSVQSGFASGAVSKWQFIPRPADGTESSYGPYLHVVVPIQDSQGQTRLVMEEYAANSVVLSKVRNYNDSIALIAVLAALTLFLGLYILIRIVILMPLRRLEVAMTQVGSGDLDHGLRPGSRDEIGSLRRHFNAMRLKLKDYVDELDASKHSIEKQVIERTRQFKEEQARLDASIDSLPIGFMIVGPDYFLIRANSKLHKAIGLKDIAQGFASVENQLVGFDLRAKIGRVLSARRAQSFRKVPIGTKFLNIMIAPVLVEEASSIIGTVILIDDVTEDIILQRSKDEFFSIASHELRTPLTAIRGNATLIQEFYTDKKKDPRLSETVAGIKESATYLIGIVNEFLDMSRLEQGRIDLKKGPVDVLNVVEESVSELMMSATQKNLTIQIKPQSKKLPLIQADRDRMKQVLVNLVGNALKYTEKGGIVVGVVMEGRWVKISVEDTGRGIPEESQKLLFRKFQQASGNIYTRDFTRSTGLGLYIARLIVEGMGGRIELESSAEGKGSVFSFMLPAGAAKANKNVRRPEK